MSAPRDLDMAIAIAAGQGHFELKRLQAVDVYDTLDSLRLLTYAMTSLAAHCVEGIGFDGERMRSLLSRPLMLVVALVPRIGYDGAAAISMHAQDAGFSLRESALAIGGISAAQFDDWSMPGRCSGPVEVPELGLARRDRASE